MAIDDDARIQALRDQVTAANRDLDRLRDAGAPDEELLAAFGVYSDASGNLSSALRQSTERQKAEQAERARIRADGQDFEKEIGWTE